MAATATDNARPNTLPANSGIQRCTGAHNLTANTIVQNTPLTISSKSIGAIGARAATLRMLHKAHAVMANATPIVNEGDRVPSCVLLTSRIITAQCWLHACLSTTVTGHSDLQATRGFHGICQPPVEPREGSTILRAPFVKKLAQKAATALGDGRYHPSPRLCDQRLSNALIARRNLPNHQTQRLQLRNLAADRRMIATALVGELDDANRT
jgi:hypothetical protein